MTQQLDLLWVRVRRHVLLLADGATANYDPKGDPGKPDSKEPGNAGEEVADLERQWAEAKTVGDKERVLWHALEMVFHHVPQGPRPPCGHAERRICRLEGCFVGSGTKIDALPYMPETDNARLSTGAIKQMRGEREWKVAIAEDPDPLRVVAKRYGVAHETVRNYKDRFSA